MATNRLLISVLAVLAIASVGGSTHDPQLLEGKQPRQPASSKPTVRASFPRESYRPGDSARLIIASRATGVEIQIFRAGVEDTKILANDLMLGRPMAKPTLLARTRAGQVVQLSIGAGRQRPLLREVDRGRRAGRLRAVRGPAQAPRRAPRRGRAARPRPGRPTTSATTTGTATTTPGTRAAQTARTGRPFENRGVPTHYKRYDQPFLRWLATTGRRGRLPRAGGPEPTPWRAGTRRRL